MVNDFPIRDVSTWPVDSLEPGGKDEKVWLRAPDDSRWLFKPAVVRHGRRQGEDWAEKAASELARLMSVPVARVEMASRGGAPGSISLDLAPDPAWELHTGAVLISEIDPRFVSQSKERLGHNLRNVASVLSRVGRPSGFEGPADFTAFEVFCGYLVYDAWVANRDRHEENWSVLRGPDGTVTLAASYDHGSSLAFGLTDDRRSKLLGDELGVERWAAKGTAWRFEGCRSVSLVDFAVDALGMVRPKARDFWIAQLGTVSRDEAEAVVFATPEMSEAASRFCVRLLDVNRRRLLDAK